MKEIASRAAIALLVNTKLFVGELAHKTSRRMAHGQFMAVWINRENIKPGF